MQYWCVPVLGGLQAKKFSLSCYQLSLFSILSTGKATTAQVLNLSWGMSNKEKNPISSFCCHNILFKIFEKWLRSSYIGKILVEASTLLQALEVARLTNTSSVFDSCVDTSFSAHEPLNCVMHKSSGFWIQKSFFLSGPLAKAKVWILERKDSTILHKMQMKFRFHFLMIRS